MAVMTLSLPRSPVPASGTCEEYPLSDAQEHVWFLDQLVLASPAHNIHNAVRLTGLLDVTVLAGNNR